MDVLIEDISQCCIKVYTLEKVLRRKKDSATQVDFLTEAMKVSPVRFACRLLSAHDLFSCSKRSHPSHFGRPWRRVLTLRHDR